MNVPLCLNVIIHWGAKQVTSHYLNPWWLHFIPSLPQCDNTVRCQAGDKPLSEPMMVIFHPISASVWQYSEVPSRWQAIIWTHDGYISSHLCLSVTIQWGAKQVTSHYLNPWCYISSHLCLNVIIQWGAKQVTSHYLNPWWLHFIPSLPQCDNTVRCQAGDKPLSEPMMVTFHPISASMW